jgi:tricorn protease
VFSYAGDLWSVPREGGEAKRLTAGPGVETDPVFSPDGSLIAFTGEYDGNVDVFVMPASGGVPRRLTYHPGQDAAVGWTPDGKRVLFVSSRAIPNDGARLYTLPVEGGGLPEELPLPIALGGILLRRRLAPGLRAAVSVAAGVEALSRRPDAQDLDRQPGGFEHRENPAGKLQRLQPHVGRRPDLLSLRPGRPGDVVLLRHQDTTRSRAPSPTMGWISSRLPRDPGAIVYEQFGELHLYDLKTGQTKAVAVTLAGDLPELRPHFVNVAKRLRNADISPNGLRAVFEARGEILTVPADKGDPRNLTNSTAVMEREPVWSPDGQSIAYLSDESGDYALQVRNQDGTGEALKIPLGKAYYTTPRWSPDSKKIAYQDNHNHLFYVDLAVKKPVLVETDFYFNGGGLAPAWSPDSQWLTYSKTLKSHMAAIYLYSLADAKSTQVTDGMSDAENPVFDKNGKYSVLYRQHQFGCGHAAGYREFFAAGDSECVSSCAGQERSVAAGAGKRRREEEGRRRQERRRQERTTAKKDDKDKTIRTKIRAPPTPKWKSKSISKRSASAFWRSPCRPSGM